MKKILLTILMVIVGVISTATEKLYVGTNAEFPPFEYREKNEIVGFDIELIKEIGKLTGYEIKIVDMNFDALIPSLQLKKIDAIIAGMTATDERKKHINFTKNYYISQQVIVSVDKPVNKLEELQNKKIGVVLGYTGDTLITAKKGYNVIRYSSTSAAIMALKTKKVDGIILDEEPAIHYAKVNKGLLVNPIDDGKEEYAIAIRKKDKALLDKINEALDTLKTNGTYKKLYDKYFTK